MYDSTEFSALFAEQVNSTITTYQSHGQVDNFADDINQPPSGSQPFGFETSQPGQHFPLPALGEESRFHQPQVPFRPTYATQLSSVEPESNISSLEYGPNGSFTSGRAGMNARRHTETRESGSYLTSISSDEWEQNPASIETLSPNINEDYSDIPRAYESVENPLS